MQIVQMFYQKHNLEIGQFYSADENTGVIPRSPFTKGRHQVNSLGELYKSWTFYPGQYSDLSEGSTKTK